MNMRPIKGGRCALCGEPLAGTYCVANAQGEIVCPMCRDSEPPFVKAVAYGSYEGGLRDLIHLLKYERVRPAANVLGRMLAEVVAGFAPCFQDSRPLVVPVPLHASKLRERGFNQVEVFTRAALKLKPAGMELSLQPAVLERSRRTASQTGLSIHQRRENMRGAFQVVQPGLIRGADVLLVDDVMTTGTTVSECARILRRAGANRVWVATVARTLKHEATFAQAESDAQEEVNMARAAHG